MYQIKSGMYDPTDVSQVGLAAAVHLGLAPHNFGIQEYMVHSGQTREVFGPTYEFAHGGLRPSEEPGLGIHFDEDLAAAHSYERAYLPVNRLRTEPLIGEANRRAAVSTVEQAQVRPPGQ